MFYNSEDSKVFISTNNIFIENDYISNNKQSCFSGIGL